MKLFELVATLVLDTNGFNSEVDKATKSGEELGSTLEKSVAKGTAKGQALYDFTKSAAVSIFDFGRDLVETAASVQAENSAFEQTFGDMADAASDAFGRLGEENNIFSTRLKTVGTKAFAQFKGSGLDAADSLGMMEEYLQLAADAAAYYDMSLNDVDERLRSFLRGNTEAGDAIGLFTSALQRDQYALEMYDQKWQDLTESQRQTLLMSVVRDIYDQTKVLGQAKNEAESYQNTLDNLNAIWTQIKAALGGPILDAMLPAVKEFSEFLQKNPEIVEAMAETLGEIADLTFSGLMELLKFIADNGDSIVGFLEGLGGAVGWISELLGFKPAPTVPELTQQVIDAWNEAALWEIENDPETARPMYDTSIGMAWDGTGNIQDYINQFLLEYNKNNPGLEQVGASVDYDQMSNVVATAVAQEVSSALNGVSVKMDGQVVGRLVASEVGKQLSLTSTRRRFTT